MTCLSDPSCMGVALFHNPAPHAEYIADLITELFIEAFDLPILAAHQEIDLPHAALPQPGFGAAHCRRSQSLALPRGLDRDVVEHAAMAVMPDHHRGGNDAVDLAHQYLRAR